MTTLISCGNSEGTRNCDSKCYDAKGKKCVCCCGGLNHGVGLKQAQENTQQLAEITLSHAGLKISDYIQPGLPI